MCGIDLGTTNSAVAIVVDGRAVIVPDERGRRTLPSVVSYAEDGSVLVGHDARRRLSSDPRNTFHSTKRFIGKRFKDSRVGEDARRVPFDVAATVAADAADLGIDGLGPNRDGAGFVAFRCPRLGRKVSPEEIASEILRVLLARAADAVGSGAPIERAVITVPAYFDDAQCAATERAAKRAGCEKVRLLREPVAAAIAYGVDVGGDETVFVFDLGGGTFDVSVLDVGGGVVEVLATGGDPHLGGDDLDRALALWLAREAEALGAGVDPRGALMAARRARERLSEETETVVPMPGGAAKTLTRPVLEKCCASVLRRMRMPVETAADAAGINLEALQTAAARKGKRSDRGAARKAGRPFDHVLLVGGATKTPAVRRFVENTFGRKPSAGLVNPDEVVALGAAAHAGALEGVATASDALGPMQASLIRAFAAKMREENRDAFERAVEGVGGGSDEAFGVSDEAPFGGSDEAFGGSDEASRRGDDATVEWDAAAMAGAARRAGMDLAGGGRRRRLGTGRRVGAGGPERARGAHGGRDRGATQGRRLGARGLGVTRVVYIGGFPSRVRSSRVV